MPIRTHSQRPAFTLTELIIVIAVIALLIAIAIPTLRSSRDRARAAKAMVDIRSAAAGVTLYLSESRDVFPYAGVPNEPFTPVTVNGVASTQQYLYAHAAFTPNLIRPYVDAGLLMTFIGADTDPDQVHQLASAPSPIARFWLTQSTATDPAFWTMDGPVLASHARATRESEVRFPSQKVLLYCFNTDPTTGRDAIASQRFNGIVWAMIDGSSRKQPRAETFQPAYVRPWGSVPIQGLATDKGLQGVDVP